VVVRVVAAAGADDETYDAESRKPKSDNVLTHGATY
jgi:hypothetical protein